MTSATQIHRLSQTASALIRTDSGERYVDWGVEIRTVEQDGAGVSPDGELPKVVQVRAPVRVGGRYDTVACKFVGPCRHWRVWYVGPKQYEIIFNPPTQHNLTLSAEGAGKTVMMSMIGHLVLMIAAGAVCPGTLGEKPARKGSLGACAPTATRLDTLLRAFSDLMPITSAKNPILGSVGTLRTDAAEIVMVSGHMVQFRATKQQSAALGSPVQGFTWKLGALVDEAQNQVHAMPDIVARTRGGFKPSIYATATAADNPDWRNYRDSLSKNWHIHRMSYKDAWAISADYWEMFKAECTDREWQRRGLAMDVGPERMTYHTWDRAVNLRPVPHIGARDVTRQVMRHWGPNYSVLVGHDPGQIVDVSIFLKCYQERGHDQPSWFVVDELTTDLTTTEQHAKKLVSRLRSKWGCNELGADGKPNDGPIAQMRIDPYGDSDNKTDRSVYQTFRHFGLDARSAAYKQGTGKGRVPKDPGIEMVCRLLRNANGDHRLFIATDDRGRPVAPRLVECLEMSERDGDGQAETQKKNKSDLSHWGAATRYALWLLERQQVSKATVDEEEEWVNV